MWNDLNLNDKTKIIQLAVKSGITDLNTIREVYDKSSESNRKLQSTRPATPSGPVNQYKTKDNSGILSSLTKQYSTNNSTNRPAQPSSKLYREGGDLNTNEYTQRPSKDKLSEWTNESKRAEEYINNYYNSEGYRQRAEESNRELGNNTIPTNNPLDKYIISYKIGSSDASNAEVGFSDVAKVNIGLVPEKHKNNMYPSVRGYNKIGVGTSTAHEMGHLNPIWRSYNINNTAPKSNINALTPSKTVTADPVEKVHDTKLGENYSDLQALRYYLYDKGIFDSTQPNTEFTEDEFNKAAQGLMSKEIDLPAWRFMNTHTKEQTIDAINKVASINKTNNLGNKAADGGPLWDPNNILLKYQNNENTNNTPAPIDHEELRRRQAWTESRGDNFARSKKGAVGLYQITPVALKEYTDSTGNIGDLTDPVYSKEVRDWFMNRLTKSSYINNPALSDSMKVARQYYAYNAGLGNLKKAIDKAKSAGIDTDNDWAWMDYGYTEPKNYTNFIVRNIDSGGNRTNKEYNKNKNKIK